MWRTVKLGEISTVNSGNPAPQDESLFDTGTYPFIRTSDVGKIGIGKLNDSRDKLNEEGVSKLTLFPKGTSLFPKSGASTLLNHRVMMGIDGYVSSHLATIKGKNAVVTDDFLWYFLQTIDAGDLVVDSAYPSLNTKAIQQILVTLPPLTEQQRIVAKLDTAFAEINRAIEASSANLKQIDALRFSIFEGVLSQSSLTESGSWQKYSISDVCEELYAGGDAPPKEIRSDFETADFRIPIFSNGVDKAGLYGFTNYARTQKPAITISARGTIGHIELRNQPFLPIVRLIVAVPKHDIVRIEYLKYFLMNVKILSSGSSIPQLTVPMIKELQIILPSLEAQDGLVEMLNNASASIEDFQQAVMAKLTRLTALKSAILAQELHPQKSEAA